MRLVEEVTQQEIIDSFKEVLVKYDEFHDAVNNLSVLCDDVKDLNSNGDSLYKFCTDELGQHIHDMEEDILDVYYPIDYADDEDDRDLARERYQNSKDERDLVFKDYSI